MDTTSSSSVDLCNDNGLYNDTELQMNSRLVLCIEEIFSGSIDNRIFILYDEATDAFILRGKRTDDNYNSYVPYAFNCHCEKQLSRFVLFVSGLTPILADAKANICLYNYNNLSEMTNEEITYEFLEDHLDENYEIVGYTGVTLNSESEGKLAEWITMLGSVYNDMSKSMM